MPTQKGHMARACLNQKVNVVKKRSSHVRFAAPKEVYRLPESEPLQILVRPVRETSRGGGAGSVRTSASCKKETFEEHVSWLERVIRILLDAKLVVNRDKCEFVLSKCTISGATCWIAVDFRIDSERVRPIHDYPTPRKRKNKWSATPNEEQRRSFAARGQGKQPEGLHRQSGRRGTTRAGASSSEETPAGGKSQQEAVAELNEYVRLRSSGTCSPSSVSRRDGAVVEVFGRTNTSFCEPFDARIGGRDGLGGAVQPAITAGNGGVATTNGRRQIRASRQRRQASGVGTRQRPHRRARDVAPNGGGEPRLEEGHGPMLELLVAARQPVEEWDGRGIRGGFSLARLKRKVFCWRRGGGRYASRSGETTEESATGADPTFGTRSRTICAAVASTSQQVRLRGGTAWLGVPAVRRATAAPATDGVSHRRATNSASFAARGLTKEQQQHRQLPRRQPQQHQREGSPRGGSTSKPRWKGP
ncbi:unnamed protein product [Trichogramma brassicae]|uniref:Reverse transcriptase domain-containing protein n=1 Tax=Trichogramma brassicae TaxID=86971 RepID=A0A6H5HX88_9HYME|nr:unnamed protein product [Trichogramma brassicae]